MEKYISIKNDNYDIPAILNCPRGENLPCVIMCHGTASDKNEVGGMYADLAQALAEKGIASIRFDFAGCGDSTVSGICQTFMAEVSDTEKAYEYALTVENIDADRMGIIGFSQGGRVMAQFLDSYGDRIKAAVSWSGACHNGIGVFGGWFDGFYSTAEKQGFADIPMGWREPLTVPLGWFEDIKATRPMDALAKYSGSLLAVAGEKDEAVPCGHALEIAALNEKWRAVIMPGADHTFNVLSEDRSTAQTVIDTTAQWFSKHL